MGIKKSRAMRAIIFGGDGALGKAMSSNLLLSKVQIFRTTIEIAPPGDPGWLHIDLSGNIDDWTFPKGLDVAYMFAAITSLKACEQDPTATRRVNVENTLKLAKKLNDDNIFIVYPSSSQVFNGKLPNVLPDQPASPVTEYGRQKLEVEKQLLAFGKKAAVVRLTKVITPEMHLFGQWLNDLRSNMPIHPFRDMVFSPIPQSLTIEVMRRIVEKNISGIVQVSGKQDITYEQAASYLAQREGADPKLVQPISAGEMGWDKRLIPNHTTLDANGLINLFGIEPPDYKSVIDEFVINQSK